MGAVPKRRISKHRKGKRRSDKNLEKKNAVKCKQCGEPTMPHVACTNCGTYK